MWRFQIRGRFRTVPEDRTVPHTVGGQTYMVSEPHETQQVVQPLDLDQIVRNVLWIITLTVVLGALTWSTVAIGNLLSSMAPTWVSYLVAVVFDLTWVACMGAEWLMRYDRKRAKIPRRAGWLALAVSVAAIATEGSLATGKPFIGCTGGVVAVLAKGLWMVVMLISARRLSPLDQQWYEKASSAADAQLALAAAQRKLLRTKALVEQERQALAAFHNSPEIEAAEPSRPAVREFIPDKLPVPAPAVRPAPVGQPVPSLADKQNLSARALVLAQAGQDAGTIKDTLRMEFPDSKPDSIRKAAQRAQDKVSSAS
jgi:hypothetical protein